MSDQPKTTADQPPSGKDLPTGPGYWTRDGDIVEISRNIFGVGELGYLRRCANTAAGPVESLPRGNWFPAGQQEAIAPSGEVERLRAEIRKWIDSGCTPPPSPQELAWYACTSCNARCVKLWREPHGGKVLKCAACLSPDKPVDERGQQPTEHGQTTDQVNYWLPAVPIGDTFYGYSSVPPQCVGWWKGLPTYDAIAQERHQAEVYRQQMVEAERQRDELAEMLKVKNRAANIAELTKRAETAEAELARHPVSIAEANELQDILRTLTNSGTALKTSARELVSAWIRQAHEIDDLRGKLNDTNERLAKVREALTRLDKWAELSPFAEDILAEAQAALAEGEQP